MLTAVASLAPREAAGGDLQISEFMAINDTTLTDEDGEYRDWIEIHNTSAMAVDLTGWHLTDQADTLDRWAFPSVILAADQYLVVFASDKDRRVVGGELHTNFKLSADDAYLALVRPDGVTVEHAYDLSAVTPIADVSYGVIGVDPTPYYMNTPTPGAANVRLSAETAVYSHPSGTFATPFLLTLSVTSPTAVIHYTTDGSTPTAASPAYAGPISIAASTRVRTLVTETGMDDGPVTRRDYIALAADVANFDSNLPVVVLDTYGHGINDLAYTTVSSVFIETGSAGRAAIVDPADFAGRGGMKVRGSSSSGFPKKQYKFETWDEAGEDVSASLLGMPAESDWVLYAPYSDKSLMRNYLVYKWYREMGYYGPRTRFCEVFLNADDGTVSQADYVGVYVLTEKIKADPKRVDIDRMTAADNTGSAVTGGYILEGVASSRVEGVQNVDWFQHSNMYLNYIEPRPEDMTSAQRTYIANYLNTARTSMANSDPVNGYNKYIDAASFVDYDIVQEITNNNDSWFGSVFMYKPRDGKLYMGPVWDFNITMGNIDYGSCGLTTGWTWSHEAWPWYSRLVVHADYNQLWTDRWGAFRRDVFDLAKMMRDIDETVDLLAEAQARDQARWPTLGVYIWPNAAGYESRTTWQSEIDFLKQWLTDRVAWIDSQYLAAPRFNLDGGVVPDGFEAALEADQGTIYITTDGSDPRAVGGSVAATASVYQGGSSSPTTYLMAGGEWKYCDDGVEPPAGWTGLGFDDAAWAAGAAPLGYGGAEATTVSYGLNPADKHPTTWFRRTFPFPGGVDLAGWRLRLKVDDGAVVYLNGREVARANMPDGEIDGETYAAGAALGDGTWTEFFVPAEWVVAGDNVLAVEVHQDRPDGDDLLFDAEFQMLIPTTPSSTPILIDEVTTVTARTLYGGRWSAPVEATFAPESLPPVRIIEMNYHPHAPTAAEIAAGFVDADEFEFIDIQNVGDEPVNLLGLRLGDGVEFEFGDGALDAGGRMLLVRNADAFYARYGYFEVGGVYAGSLDNGGERVAIVDSFGRAVCSVAYDDDDPWPTRADGLGSSLEVVDPQGDYSDPANWRASEVYGGSPLWVAAAPVRDVVINEVLTHTDPPAVDSIELHNTSDAAVDIGGWYLSDSTDDYFKFRIPDGVTIPAGGYVVFNEYDFNVTGLNSTPDDDDPKDFGLDAALGDEVHLLSGGYLVRFIDEVAFGAAFNGVPFGRYPNGSGALTLLQTTTLGAANNDDPVLGSVIISEIMYHPLAADGAVEDDLEYVELRNLSDAVAPLDGYDSDGDGAVEAEETAPWRLDGAVEFEFPAGTALAPGGTLLVVDFDPTDLVKLNAFMTAYGLAGLTPGVDIVGGWGGQLGNGGEELQLLTPDSPPAGETFHPYIATDCVAYDDQAPWPADADGTGLSLTRMEGAFGNDPAGWLAAEASPGWIDGGAPTYPPADFDGDGVVGIDDFVILKNNFGDTHASRYDGDANGDGVVGIDDFVVLKNTFGDTGAARGMAGDLNGDGTVDIADFVILKNNFGRTDAASPADGDADGDGVVDIADFVMLKNHFGLSAD